MNEFYQYTAGDEPERYELDAGLPYHFELTRREVLKTMGGGILVFYVLRDAAAQPGRRGFGRRGNATAELGAWLHIDEQGLVTVYTGKVEVGQNIRTSLTQAVAEELPTAVDKIQLVMGDTQQTPFDMGTFGSRTTPDMAVRLRQIAATTRELLLELAAEHFQVSREDLVAADGVVTCRTKNTSRTFGELTEGKKLTKTITNDAQTKSASEWSISGASIPKVNGRDFVSGRHKYTSDVKLPGMLFGKIVRPPSLNAKLTNADTGVAQKTDGVTVVHDGDLLGVAAPTEAQAHAAIENIQANWEEVPQISGGELFKHLKDTAENGGGRGGFQAGSMEEGLKLADVRLEQSYTVAYIAHAPLEPRAAVAQWNGDQLTVWTGTQRPFGVRGDLASAFRIAEQNVRVIVPDTGSGYGGKHSGEAAIEAARLARACGKPVKIVWSREEEFTWAYFRPAGLIEVRSGARRDGSLTAWEFHNYNSGGSAIRTPYDVAHQQIVFHNSDAPLRQGSYRALASTANVFARETHMDEIAHELTMDPLELRIKNLSDERMRGVLEAAAERFQWGRTPRENHGVGMACGFEKGSYVATCAEVFVEPTSGRVKVVRAVSAFECGAVVNPDHLKNQVEGALVQGLGGALFEAMEFDNGRILNASFSGYRVPRFRDTPIIDVVLVDRKDLPSAGAGETPIIGIAPAVGNALFAATGVRLRSMPLAPKGMKSGG